MVIKGRLNSPAWDKSERVGTKLIVDTDVHFIGRRGDPNQDSAQTEASPPTPPRLSSGDEPPSDR